MPPKCKFTRQEVIAAALALTREQGAGALTARALGERLGSSPRPIFSLFESMQEVQEEVLKAADALYQSYLQEDMAAGRYPPYKASGMAYIRFAREQRELFKLLFMRDRSREAARNDGGEIRPVLDALRASTGLSQEAALLFHLEMWLYVHGIAVMVATSYWDWDEETVSRVLTDGFQGLRARHGEEAQDGRHTD